MFQDREERGDRGKRDTTVEFKWHLNRLRLFLLTSTYLLQLQAEITSSVLLLYCKHCRSERHCEQNSAAAAPIFSFTARHGMKPSGLAEKNELHGQRVQESDGDGSQISLFCSGKFKRLQSFGNSVALDNMGADCVLIYTDLIQYYISSSFSYRPCTKTTVLEECDLILDVSFPMEISLYNLYIILSKN